MVFLGPCFIKKMVSEWVNMIPKQTPSGIEISVGLLQIFRFTFIIFEISEIGHIQTYFEEITVKC